MTAKLGCLGSVLVLGAVYALAQAAGIPDDAAGIVAFVGVFAALIGVGFINARRAPDP